MARKRRQATYVLKQQADLQRKQAAMSVQALVASKYRKRKLFSAEGFVEELDALSYPVYSIDMHFNAMLELLDIPLHSIRNPSKHSEIIQKAIEKRKSGAIGIYNAIQKTKLLSGLFGKSSNATGPYINGLKHLVDLQDSWIRSPEDWSCGFYSVDRLFSSLSRFLLCEYPVPAFLDSAFTYRDYDHTGFFRIARECFLHIGQGKSLRRFKKFPVPLTRRMAHCFINAPKTMNAQEAFRWAQVVSVGGTPHLARAINNSRLGTNLFRKQDFWAEVILFLSKHPMLDMAQVGPIIDYIDNQKFETQARIGNGIIVDQAPPQPNFSLKGRTINSLMRQVERWHGDLAKIKSKNMVSWKSCGILGMSFMTGGKEQQKIWKISEILNSSLLKAEGSQMSHCVGSYVGSCFNGTKAIYSMTKDTGRGPERQLTISVLVQSKMINEVRQAHNRIPNSEQKNIVRKWASLKGLRY